MPSIVRCAYANAGWSTMATCESGSLEEYRLLRASYADVIAERELRAHEGVAAATAAEAQAARTLLEAAELRRWARSVRDTAVGFRARLDQMQAMLRDNEAPPPSMPGPTGST